MPSSTSSSNGTHQVESTMTTHCLRAVDTLVNEYWQFNRKPMLTLADFGHNISSTSMWLSAMESIEKVTVNAELHLCCQEEKSNQDAPWTTVAKTSSELRKYIEAINDQTAVSPSLTSISKEIPDTNCAQWLPPDTVDLGFSGTASLWLQTVPSALTHDNGGCVDPMDLPVDDCRHAALAEQAAVDWENYLNRRIREMAANSFHLALVLAVDEQGHRSGRNEQQKSPVSELCAIWKQLVTDQEFKRTLIPAYSRTMTEILEPFDKCQRTIDQADKVNVEMCELVKTACPHRLSYLLSGDDAQLAQKLTQDVKVWSESIFLGALGHDRNELEKRELINQLFLRLEQQIAQDANNYAMDYVHVLLLIRKN